MEETVMSLSRAAAAQLSSSKSLTKSSNLKPKGEEVESTKAEMSKVREENTRLKMLLRKIENEYKTLKMRVQPENKKGSGNNKDIDQESELISLCLGRINRNEESKKEEINCEISKNEDLKNGNTGLRLGLANYDESKFDTLAVVNSSPDNSLSGEDTKEEENNKTALKTMRSGEDDVVSQLANVKRARVSVRARCTTPTMNDGCQWRKYGQKIAKSNPCPRAYYRCTVATSCPVRKQVQRCVDDMSILITTYEGTHNHPLPISATAMASTTSAAASMLLSGSSTSSHNLTTNFNGFNIDNNNNMPNDPNTSTRPFYVPNSSSFPSITLDLTTSTSTSSTQRFPMTCNLGYSQSYSSLQSTIWDSVINPNPAYNIATPFSQNIGSFQTGNLFQQPQLQKNHQMSSQQVLTETLTKAITSDPTFRSVIAAAISTMAGGERQSHAQANDHNVETQDRNLRCNNDQERSPVRISSPASHQAI